MNPDLIRPQCLNLRGANISTFVDVHLKFLKMKRHKEPNQTKYHEQSEETTATMSELFTEVSMLTASLLTALCVSEVTVWQSAASLHYWV